MKGLATAALMLVLWMIGELSGQIDVDFWYGLVAAVVAGAIVQIGGRK